MTEQKKAAIYCRLSEEDRNKQSADDESGSIQNQKAMLLQYAAAQHWEVFHIYSDDDYAYADRNRPAFNRLLEDAQHHRFDIVLCKTQSRFTRELELVEKYIHGLFPLWGIRFVSIVDNADTANRGNKKSRQINGLVNEWYLEDMSENIRSVLTNRRQNGYHIGSFALYGYKKDPAQKGHLLIDEDAAQIVREVFTLFSKGYGKTAIARMLNDRGVPNPTEYKRLQGLRYQQSKPKSSTLWKYAAISHMLTNEIYIGNMVQGKYGSISYKTKENKPRPKEQWYRVEGTHAPIIDAALWDRVQRLIQEKSKPFATGTVGLFARKVRCAACGYTMRSTKNRGRHYLQCQTRHIAQGACTGAFLSVEKLENIVLSELKRLTALYLDRNALEGNLEFCSSLQQQQQRLQANLSDCQRKIDECARGFHSLYLDKVRGILSEEEYLSLVQAFRNEKARLQGHFQIYHAQMEELDSRLSDRDNHRAQIEQYTNPTHLTKELVDAFIDYISVGKRIPGTRNVPIENPLELLIFLDKFLSCSIVEGILITT